MHNGLRALPTASTEHTAVTRMLTSIYLNPSKCSRTLISNGKKQNGLERKRLRIVRNPKRRENCHLLSTYCMPVLCGRCYKHNPLSNSPSPCFTSQSCSRDVREVTWCMCHRLRGDTPGSGRHSIIRHITVLNSHTARDLETPCK